MASLFTTAKAQVDSLMTELVPTTKFYVATDGSDSDPGTQLEPFLTLGAAQTAVRAEIVANGLGAAGIDVIIREGEYYQTSSLAMTSLDEGASGTPVTWKAAEGETVLIHGGLELDSSSFSELTTGTVYDRMPVAAQGNVMEFDLGTTDTGTLKNRGNYIPAIGAGLLFVDNAEAPIAGWPALDADPADCVTSSETVGSTAVFVIPSGSDAATKMSAWEDAPDPWFHGQWRYAWADEHIDVTSIVASTRTVTLTKIPRSGASPSGNRPFRIYNVIEEITEGAWYIEGTTLYYWPAATITTQDLKLSMPEVPLITVTGADYIEFEGIQFGMGRANLLELTNGSNINFNNCTFFGSGNDALYVDGGTDHQFTRNTFRDTGDSGIEVAVGDMSDLTSGNVLIENNLFERWQRWQINMGKAVLLSDSVGVTIRHNEFSDAPGHAMNIKGANNTIELNDISAVCKRMSDGAAIYENGNWAYRGNLYEGNWIHDIVSQYPPDEYDAHGIYLDDLNAGSTVQYNYFIDICGSGTFHGGGRDNEFINNIYERCWYAHFADARGGEYLVHPLDPPEGGGGRDYYTKMTNVGVAYQDATWTAAFPRLAAIPSDNAVMTSQPMDGSATDWRGTGDSKFNRNMTYDPQNGVLHLGVLKQVNDIKRSHDMSPLGSWQDPVFSDPLYAELDVTGLDVQPDWTDYPNSLALDTQPSITGWTELPTDVGIEI